jgi:hypothetical protein
MHFPSSSPKLTRENSTLFRQGELMGAMPTLAVGMRIAEKSHNIPTASVGMAPYHSILLDRALDKTHMAVGPTENCRLSSGGCIKRRKSLLAKRLQIQLCFFLKKGQPLCYSANGHKNP